MSKQNNDRYRRWQRWTQISLRSFIVMVGLLCVLLTAWQFYAAKYIRQSRAIARLQQFGMYVSTQPAPGPRWLAKAIGEENFLEVTMVRTYGAEDFGPSLDPQDKRLSFDDRVLEQCQYLISLESLDIRQTKITDSGLRHIRHLTSLRSLYLGCTDISDEGLEHIQQLTGLEVLELKNSKVTDSGLAKLTQLRNLEHFWLESPYVKGAGLAFLRNCPKLTRLSFTGVSANNEWVRSAGPPRSVTWVYFNGTSINDEGVALLKVCNKLADIHLNNNPITDNCLPHFLDLPINRFQHQQTLITPSGYTEFCRQRQLRAESKTPAE